MYGQLSIEDVEETDDEGAEVPGILRCVKCGIQPREYLLKDCMHVALCELCIVEFVPDKTKPAKECPLCDTLIKSKPNKISFY